MSFGDMDSWVQITVYRFIRSPRPKDLLCSKKATDCAPKKMEYPINRFTMEAKRQMDVLDRRLAENRYLAGDEYTVADIETWPWYGNLVLGRQYNAGEFLDVESYTHLRRWAEEILARPAVQRGRIVNRTSGDPSEQLHERHDASDFDLRTQDKLETSKVA